MTGSHRTGAAPWLRRVVSMTAIAIAATLTVSIAAARVLPAQAHSAPGDHVRLSGDGSIGSHEGSARTEKRK